MSLLCCNRLELTVDLLRVSWSFINTSKQYRFVCYVKNGSNWQQLPDSEFVTNLTGDTPPATLLGMSCKIIEVLESAGVGYFSQSVPSNRYKTQLDLLSWISPEHYEAQAF